MAAESEPNEWSNMDNISREPSITFRTKNREYLKDEIMSLKQTERPKYYRCTQRHKLIQEGLRTELHPARCSGQVL